MKFEELIADVFAINASEVSNELLLRDIATWDSMSHMLLIARLEETFAVQFSGDEIADFKKIGDIRATLRNYKPDLG